VPLEAFQEFASKTVVSTVQALSAANLRHAKFIDGSYEKQFEQQRKEHAANFQAAAETQKKEYDEWVNTLKKEHEEKSSIQEKTIANLRDQRDDLELKLAQTVTRLRETERQNNQAEVMLHEKGELIEFLDNKPSNASRKYAP
jgi:chromosome segregation ATPase